MNSKQLLGKLSHVEEELAAVRAELRRVRRQARREALLEIHRLMHAFDVTTDDLRGLPAIVPLLFEARYRDERGNAWSGNGERPSWLRAALAEGRQLEDFAVDPDRSRGSRRHRPADTERSRAPLVAPAQPSGSVRRIPGPLKGREPVTKQR